MADDKPRLIKLLHVARRDLQIDEDTWRAMLLEQTGKRSSKDLTHQQLERVLGHLKTRGFKVRKPVDAKPRRERRPLDTAADSRKARAVWLLLAEIGAVRDPSESALNAYVRRQAGVDDLRWVTDMLPIIEGLKAWAARLLPQALQIRFADLQRAGAPLRWPSVAALIASVSFRRSPTGFVVLEAAWSELKSGGPVLP